MVGLKKPSAAALCLFLAAAGARVHGETLEASAAYVECKASGNCTTLEPHRGVTGTIPTELARDLSTLTSL